MPLNSAKRNIFAVPKHSLHFPQHFHWFWPSPDLCHFLRANAQENVLGCQPVPTAEQRTAQKQSECNLFVQEDQKILIKPFKVFLQVLLIGALHMFCTLLYVYMQYFPVPIWVVMSASYAWIASQGDSIIFSGFLLFLFRIGSGHLHHLQQVHPAQHQSPVH